MTIMEHMKKPSIQIIPMKKRLPRITLSNFQLILILYACSCGLDPYTIEYRVTSLLALTDQKYHYFLNPLLFQFLDYTSYLFIFFFSMGIFFEIGIEEANKFEIIIFW